MKYRNVHSISECAEAAVDALECHVNIVSTGRYKPLGGATVVRIREESQGSSELWMANQTMIEDK